MEKKLEQRSLSCGSEWQEGDAEAFEQDLKRARAATFADDSDSVESQEHEFQPEETWDWMKFGPAPNDKVNVNVELSSALLKLSKFYSLFPESVPLGMSGTSNEIRSLNARRIWNTVRALPRPVRRASMLRRLPGFDGKWFAKIDRLLQFGQLEIQEQYADATPVLKLFRNILWTGRDKSWRFYNQGCRTLEHVSQRHDLDWRQRLGLENYSDLNSPLDRAEVEDFGKIIRRELDELDPDLTMDTLGSYSRNESPCSDADFLISHPRVGCERRLDELVEMLQKGKGDNHGTILHVLNPDNDEAPRFGKSQSRADGWFRARKDAKELDFRLIMALAKTRVGGAMRRIDLFLCSRRSRAPMTLYLTGNVWFNRKLRQYADQNMGYYCCNSAFGKRVGSAVESIELESERDIFRELKIDYVAPKDRLY